MQLSFVAAASFELEVHFCQRRSKWSVPNCYMTLPSSSKCGQQLLASWRRLQYVAVLYSIRRRGTTLPNRKQLVRNYNAARNWCPTTSTKLQCIFDRLGMTFAANTRSNLNRSNSGQRSVSDLSTIAQIPFFVYINDHETLGG